MHTFEKVMVPPNDDKSSSILIMVGIALFVCSLLMFELPVFVPWYANEGGAAQANAYQAQVLACLAVPTIISGLVLLAIGALMRTKRNE